MLPSAATIVSGAIGVGIIFLGARFLVAPNAAAAGYGVPVAAAADPSLGREPYCWLYVKGVRDIASGIFLFILLANRSPHMLGAFMAAASLIPIGDALIVLRSGGSRAVAFGIHGVTAVVMLAASAALLIA
jgi:hypothetical protein